MCDEMNWLKTEQIYLVRVFAVCHPELVSVWCVCDRRSDGFMCPSLCVRDFLCRSVFASVIMHVSFMIYEGMNGQPISRRSVQNETSLFTLCCSVSGEVSMYVPA